MAKVAWIECPVCGGVGAVLADPDFAPIDGVTTINLSDFTYRDGTPFDSGTLATCKDCGAKTWNALRASMIRRGDALPPKKEPKAA